MALTPLLSFAGRRLAARLRAEQAVDPELTARPAGGQSHAIVVGYGRVGKVVCALLQGARHSAISPPISTRLTVTRDRRDGHDVYYGDAADPSFLEVCGLATAAGVIITIHSRDLIDEWSSMCARCGPTSLSFRARATPTTRSHLYASALPMRCPRPSKRACSSRKRRWWDWVSPTGPVIASIHEKRDEIRHALQQAALEAGQTSSQR